MPPGPRPVNMFSKIIFPAPGEVVAPISPGQASLLSIKNICLPLLETGWIVPWRGCESLPLKQPRGPEGALEIGVQGPGTGQGGAGGQPQEPASTSPLNVPDSGCSHREEGLGCAETRCPAQGQASPSWCAGACTGRALELGARQTWGKGVALAGGKEKGCSPSVYRCLHAPGTSNSWFPS